MLPNPREHNSHLLTRAKPDLEAYQPLIDPVVLRSSLTLAETSDTLCLWVMEQVSAPLLDSFWVGPSFLGLLSCGSPLAISIPLPSPRTCLTCSLEDALTCRDSHRQQTQASAAKVPRDWRCYTEHFRTYFSCVTFRPEVGSHSHGRILQFLEICAPTLGGHGESTVCWPLLVETLLVC